MNEKPTSGPIAASRIHQDRAAISSRHSFSRSQAHAPSTPAQGTPPRSRTARGRRAAPAARADSSSAVPSAHTRPPLSSTNRSQIRRGVVNLVDRDEERPAATSACQRSVASTWRLWRRSSPSNGSSMSSTGCEVSRPTASSARFRWPLESVPIVECEQRAERQGARRPRRAGRARPPRKPDGEAGGPSPPSGRATGQLRRAGRRESSDRRPRVRLRRQRDASRDRPAAGRRGTRTASSCRRRSGR